MAKVHKMLALDLINAALRDNDGKRGFILRILYRDRVFARQWRICGYDGTEIEISFRHLKDAIDTVMEMEKMCELSRKRGENDRI